LEWGVYEPREGNGKLDTIYIQKNDTKKQTIIKVLILLAKKRHFWGT
jgi:hypothetical protein